MLPSDDEDAARRAQMLLDDPRVTHFHDPEQYAGRAWAGVLGLQSVAWDVYLLFDERAAWGDPVPVPREWFHQLGDERADPVRRRTGHALAQALHGAGRAAGWPVAPEAPEAAQWDAAREAALARLPATDQDGDERCADCRAARRLSSCSLGGWRHLVLRQEGGGGFIASGTEPVGDADGRREVCLSVTGMRCPECMLRAGAGAIAVKGVEEVGVRLDDGEMCILIAWSATVRDEDVAAAVRAQGFGAAVIPCAAGSSASGPSAGLPDLPAEPRFARRTVPRECDVARIGASRPTRRCRRRRSAPPLITRR